MLETIYKSKFLIDEIEHSPFSSHFIALINWSLKEGYHPTAIQGRFAGIVHFLRWSASRNITPKTVRRRHVDEFLKLLAHENKSTVQSGGWAFLKRFFKSVQREGGIPLMEEPLGKIPTWIESHADKAIHHLSTVNGLSEYSLVRIRGLIRSFLIWRFKDKKGDLSRPSNRMLASRFPY